eukprot:6975415-Lingulodinium_polyedra.AAC.1
MTRVEHDRRVEEAMRPLNRTIMQYRAKSDQLAIGNATLLQKVQRLETLVDQLQDEVKNNVP